MTEDKGGSVGATASERFLALDSLRGVCAVLVAIFHFQSIGYIHATLFIQHCYMFVDFFFVLSGFVICASYGRRIETGFPIGRFMLLRLGRLYPLHLFTLLLFLGAASLGPQLASSLSSRVPFQGAGSLSELLYGSLFVQIFFGTGETWWNPPTWSIAAEIWVYLIAALLFRTAKHRLVPIVLIVTAASLPLYIQCLRFDGGSHHWGAVPRCLFGFGQGILAYRLFQAARSRLAGWSTRAWTALETTVMAVALVLVIGNYSLIGPFSFTAVVIVFAFQGGWWARLLLARPMLFLGTLSYSIYMLHFFMEARYQNALKLFGRLAGSPHLLERLQDPTAGGSRLVADIATLGLVPTIVAAAWCTYHLIERPGQRWSRRVVLGGGAKPARRAEAAAPTF